MTWLMYEDLQVLHKSLKEKKKLDTAGNNTYMYSIHLFVKFLTLQEIMLTQT